MRTILLISCGIFLFSVVGFGQLSGTVVDEDGNPLAFANIYIDQSTVGTSSNDAGQFYIKIPNGPSTVVFQYVGYKSKRLEIDYSGEPIESKIQLLPESFNLEKITILADGEDPAYGIIRKAQQKRTYYRDLVTSYKCDVFIKGNQKVLDAPEKVLGQEVGDFDGALDTNRQGIVYLSESISEVYFDRGKTKEILKSSKVSGQDQGYSFNSAVEMDHSFYDNTANITRAIISPIASNAMSFYKYKLLGAQLDENGYLINQIQVTPKSESLPAYTGEIYIVEDLWNIHSLDLLLTASSLGVPILDTLNFKHIYIPTDTRDKWVLSSNVISFRAGAIGFDFNGTFAAVYTNYNFDLIDPSFFSDEIFSVEKESNKRTEAYWDSIRPIPLTTEEQIDYVRKDSIRIVRESPAYLDSIDREANRFGIFDILTGYSYQNSQKHRSFSFDSPLGNVGFNTIQGLKSKIVLGGSVAANKERDYRWRYQGSLDYGLSEQKIRPYASIRYNHDRINYLRVNLEAGNKLSQYNSTEPVGPAQNLYETLFRRRNYFKAFDEKLIALQVSRFLNPKAYFTFGIKYAQRSSVDNFSDYSFFKKDDRAFTANVPVDVEDQIEIPFTHNAFITSAKLRLNPGRKIYRYPEYIFWSNADYVPTIEIDFRAGLKMFDAETDFGVIKLGVYDEISLGVKGDLSYHFGGGSFLWKSADINFIDYIHFNGNQSYDVMERGIERFLSLPYHEYSTNNAFMQLNLEHDFNGYMLDRIPLVKKLGWQVILGSRFLYLDQDNYYQEYSVGLDNIGYKILRIFQVHGVWSPQNEDPYRFVLSIKDEF